MPRSIHRRVPWAAGLVALCLAGGGASAVPAAAADSDPVVIVSTDFTDGTFAPWTQSGTPTLSVTPVDGNPALLVQDRANDYDGIESPTGLLEPGVEYTFSLRARLAEGTAGTAGFRFVVKPAYTYVGDTTITADEWTTVTGSYIAPAGADPSTLSVYLGSGNLTGPYDYLVDDILITRAGGDGPVVEPGIVLSTDFEDGLGGWVPRGDADGDPTVAVTTAQANTGAQSALVSNRTTQGDGIGYDVSSLLVSGVTYEITASVRLGSGTAPVWLSMQRTNAGAPAFDTIGQFAGVGSSGWTQVTATYQLPSSDTAFLYFETAFPDGTTADLYVDDIVISALAPPVVEDLLPIKDTVDFPVGVAIDSRETTGAPSQLLLRHFDQVTAENYMKPEAFYDADGNFRINPEATTLMDYAVANDLDVYGHTLVWHSQTPAFFFQAADGTPLTTSEADKQILRDRMRTHIFNVAESLSTGGGYGEFGSDTNPITAFDVVNEVVSDGRSEADGLRRSEWYRILGEEFIDLAFAYADEAFNDTYAAAGSDRPVTLAINDYNTEQSGKQQRLHALVERMLGRGVPVDAVGHQFHVSLATPVPALEAAIVAFQDLPVKQVVSELDVTIGTPVTEANLIEQGYYYRDAFRVFRQYSADLFSVTVWGLYDARSWRAASGAPLLFDDRLTGKPAYYGAVDGELAARQRAEFVFQGDVPIAAGATDDTTWSQLPLFPVETTAQFQLRWEADHLTAYVSVTDATAQATDALTFVVDGVTSTFRRDGTGDVPGVVAPTSTGYEAVVRLPLSGATEGDQVGFDLRVTDGTTTVAWNEPGATGTLTLVEPLSYTEVNEVAAAPVIDGAIDTAWATATSVTTDKQIEGTGGATAEVSTLWRDNTLYVLAEVADPTLDATGSDPWIQDSLEIFLDAGNVKNGPYRYDDTQIRINYQNVVSFGTGDEAFQQNRLVSATSVVDGGYIVEASVSLLESGGPNSFQGLDFQVNDATAGARTSIRSWADPTGLGYQSTARWGVAELVPAAPPVVYDPVVKLLRDKIRQGDRFWVKLSGYEPGSDVTVTLSGRHGRTFDLGTVTVRDNGSAWAYLKMPRRADPGRQTLTAESGDLIDTTRVIVRRR